MKYTNNNNFPEIIKVWLKNDTYLIDESAISVTQLLKPMRAIKLYEIHKEDLERDIEELFALRLGTAIHESFEKLKLPGYIHELRLYAQLNGHRITGQFDLLKELKGELYQLEDIKTTSVWTYIYGSNLDITIKQLSMYRWLGHRHKLNIIDKAKIIYIFTDWSSAKSKLNKSYPQHRFAIKPVQLLTLHETESFIRERLHNLEDDTLPKCTDEELWKAPDVYKVYKKGRKRSLKNCSSYNEADQYIEYLTGVDEEKGERNHYTIDYDPGLVARCNYCDVRTVCEQYKQLLEEGHIKER